MADISFEPDAQTVLWCSYLFLWWEVLVISGIHSILSSGREDAFHKALRGLTMSGV